MHDVPDIHAIRVLFQRNVSKREIARLLHISRKTVDKYTAVDYVVPVRPQLNPQRYPYPLSARAAG